MRCSGIMESLQKRCHEKVGVEIMLGSGMDGGRRFLIWLMSIGWLGFLVIPICGADPAGLGTIAYQASEIFAPGATYAEYVAAHPNQGREQAFTIQFKPGEPKLRLIATYGKTLYGGDTLTVFIRQAQSEGYSVVAAINADGFDVNSGVPDGPMIHDGRLVAFPGREVALGFTAAGEAVAGMLWVNFYLKLPGGELRAAHLNTALDCAGIYLFTAEFAATTENRTLDSYDVICDIVAGRQAIDATMGLRVAGIRDGAGDTAVGPGQLVIAVAKTAANQASVAALKTLRVGDAFDLAIRDESGAGSRWPAVREAIGSLSTILEDGRIVTSDANIHPRSCIGLKPDGTVLLFELDGRQPGYSNGLNLPDVAEFLRQQGCVYALNLDGGGSAAIAVRKPGDTGLTLLNRPSDGRERSDGNAWLLVADSPGDGVYANLHLAPAQALVLAGAVLNFRVKASDSAYQPVPPPGAPEWSVSGAIGSIDGQGVFKAATAAAVGAVTATLNGRSASAVLQVLPAADFRFNVTSLTLNPGASFDLDITAAWNGIPVICQDRQFAWQVEGAIGTVDSNGLFKATDSSGASGRIIASLGEQSCAVEVNVGQLPVIVADFEDGVGAWTASGDRLPPNGVSISAESREEFVRRGDQSLKLAYDMVGGPSGAAGAYLGVSGPYLPIAGYPTHIGMWVYGDGQRHWLRGQLRDGNDAPFAVDYTAPTGVDWVGWKYVEAALPPGKALPLKLDRPLRCLETDNAKKSAGVLYIDDIRLVYGYQNDDRTSPVIGAPVPADGSLLQQYTNIRVPVNDGPSGTGIDPAKIRFYIDGESVADFMYNEAAGNVQWNTHALTNGKHQFSLRIKDKSGNEATKTWYYTWQDGSSPD